MARQFLLEIILTTAVRCTLTGSSRSAWNSSTIGAGPALRPGAEHRWHRYRHLQLAAGGGARLVDRAQRPLGERAHGSPRQHEGLLACMGLPVKTASGDFWHNFTDFDIAGRGFNLHLDRTYNSQAAAYDGRFGFGWSDTYNMFLGVDAASGMVLVHQEAGLPNNTDPSWSLLFRQERLPDVAGVAGQLAGRRHRIPPPRVQSVGAFVTWAIIGLVGIMAILSSGTIGLLILPFAAVGAFLAARSFSIAREGIGFVAGAGFFAVAFAFINLGNRPCPAHGAQIAEVRTQLRGWSQAWPPLLLRLRSGFC